ncbi:hypothetical protein ASZ78_009529 [Callipepla squamata]|uniref:Aminomethyltransferase folate-binding domain-containing protein n=1 Tax=Callipepla squamata TaxID=9009 RepID=A0A226NMS3_CALSU|nr:hypothetical protein ASZ78_009529 [Callipepla squamata]
MQGVLCSPPLSLPFRRFHRSLTNNNRWIRERSHESYAKNYSVVFPHDEPLAGRNMRKDPLHQVLDYDYYGAYSQEQHRDYTYKQLLADEYTFDFPPHHDVIKNECLTCRNALALFDMSYFGKFYLVGPEATKAANWLFSADVSKAPGSTVYTCMLNKRGGVESDLTVSRISPGDPGSPLAPAFQGYEHTAPISNMHRSSPAPMFSSLLHSQYDIDSVLDKTLRFFAIGLKGQRVFSFRDVFSKPNAIGLQMLLGMGGCHFPGDGYYLAIGGAVAQHNWSHITTVLQDMKLQCELIDCSEELGMMSLQGPLR